MELSLLNPNNPNQVVINKLNGLEHQIPDVIQHSIKYQDEAFGDVNCSLIATPNISLLSGKISLKESVRLKTSTPPNSINFPFMLEGSIESNFYSYPKKQQLVPNSHNAIHLIHTEGEHFIPKGKVQTFHLNLGSSYFFDNFISEDKITDNLKTSIYTLKPQVAASQPGAINPEMKHIIKSILENPYQGSMKKMFLEIKAFELILAQFHQLGKQSPKPEIPSPKHKDLAFGVKEFIEKNYLVPWTLDELARNFCTNIQTLKTSFKDTFGCSIFTHYQQLRMEFARQLLFDQNRQISEVSELLGYSHQNHFSAAFKKHFGFSPSDFKAVHSK